MAKWVLDPAAVKKASRILKLQHTPIVDMNVKLDEGYVGRYWPDPLHMIYVNPEVTTTAQAIDQILWHELAHAMQCERDFDGNGVLFMIDYWNDADALTQYEHLRISPKNHEFNEWVKLYYELQPREQEAEDIAISYAARFPLIKV